MKNSLGSDPRKLSTQEEAIRMSTKISFFYELPCKWCLGHHIPHPCKVVARHDLNLLATSPALENRAPVEMLAISQYCKHDSVLVVLLTHVSLVEIVT